MQLNKYRENLSTIRALIKNSSAEPAAQLELLETLDLADAAGERHACEHDEITRDAFCEHCWDDN